MADSFIHIESGCTVEILNENLVVLENKGGNTSMLRDTTDTIILQMRAMGISDADIPHTMYIRFGPAGTPTEEIKLVFNADCERYEFVEMKYLRR